MRLYYLFLIALISTTNARKPSNAILLSTVKSLTLRGNAKTSARRVSAIPQLKCVGGNAKGLYDVDVMRCKNTGSEYGTEDISWTCQAELPSDFKLGSTEVICEGYDSPDDPYVLKGSCGVEYRLMLTEAGESKHGRSRESFELAGAFVGLFTLLFWGVFMMVGFVIVYHVFKAISTTDSNRPRPRGPRLGGFGGGWGGDDNDPPPPYTPRAPKRRPQSSTSRAGWQPGFWSGAASGAAAGYAFGSRNSNRNNQPAQAGPSNWFGRNTQQAPAQAGPSNWFSSSTNSNRASGSNTPSTSSSTTRYESTGFGGTSRR